MTLDELNQIKRDAQNAAYKASGAKSASENIGKIRREGMPTLHDVKVPFGTEWGGPGKDLDDIAKTAIKQAVFDLLPDILRLAEMRLEATHKHQSALARAREARLAAFLGEPNDNQE